MEKKTQPLGGRDDTANTGFGPIPEQRKKYRDDLLDSIVTSGIFCCAALLIDYPDKNLFCGQVGEIQDVIVDKNENSYYLIFTDYKNENKQFAYCFVKKQHLLPLFFFNPNQDKHIKVPSMTKENETISIERIRNYWEEGDLYNLLDTSTSELQQHNKVSTRFKIGQLVTIQVDIEQEVSYTEKFTIQAGQVGIISKNRSNNAVEVIFLSAPLGKLARETEDLLSLAENQGSGSSVNKFWKKTIYIDKDLLFPLYFENLKLE